MNDKQYKLLYIKIKSYFMIPFGGFDPKSIESNLISLTSNIIVYDNDLSG